MIRSEVRHLAVAVLVVGALVLAGEQGFSAPSAALVLPLCRTGADAFTGATRPERDAIDYYYLVSNPDGTQKVETMTDDDAAERKKAQTEQYKDAAKDWAEGKKKWAAAMGTKPYPVDPPRPPKVEKLGRVSTTGTEASRQREREKYDKRLEVWDVCLLKECTGEKSVQVIRRDKRFSMQLELDTRYAEAVIAWVEAHKDAKEGDKDKDKAPVKPDIVVLKGELSSFELADKVAQKYSEELQKAKEKKAEDARKKQEQKKLEEERKKQEAEKKAADKAAEEPKNDAPKEDEGK